jgi:hypothetical protein
VVLKASYRQRSKRLPELRGVANCWSSQTESNKLESVSRLAHSINLMPQLKETKVKIGFWRLRRKYIQSTSFTTRPKFLLDFCVNFYILGEENLVSRKLTKEVLRT